MEHKAKKPLLLRRQKLLLALLQAFGGSLPLTDFQKYLFLFTQTCQKDKSYEFVPYRRGCFSFQSYADRRRLIAIGAISDSEKWQLVGEDDYLEQIPQAEQAALLSFRDRYQHLHGEKLIAHVYRQYPYYAINSKIAARLMTDNEQQAICAARPCSHDHAFFTIGYEGRSFENYLNALIKANVKILCDVRQNPQSRKYGFSKTTLSNALETLGIDYAHIPELGIASEKRQQLQTPEDYARLFDAYEASTLRQNVLALNRLQDIFIKYKRVAITCFEASHEMCHRGRIATAMAQRPGWSCAIKHI